VPISREETSNDTTTEVNSDVEGNEQNMAKIEEEADTKEEYTNSEGEDAGPIYFGFVILMLHTLKAF